VIEGCSDVPFIQVADGFDCVGQFFAGHESAGHRIERLKASQKALKALAARKVEKR